MWKKSCCGAASRLSVFRFKLPQQKRVREVVWLCDGPHLHWNHITGIYQDSWRERCSRALGPQDALKGLYIAATIDRRFYRRLYKYVNRRYLIGFCGYTSVPQRKQSCENYQETVVCILSLRNRNVSLDDSRWGWRRSAYLGREASVPWKGSPPSPRKGDLPLPQFSFVA